MDNRTIGLECTLEDNGTEMFLQFLSTMYSSFSVPWCMVNGNDNNNGEYSPTTLLSSAWLERLAENEILELVLFAYAKDALPSVIVDYDDFWKSECRLCLIYYDCGVLEVYIKNKEDFIAIWNELVLLHAQNMVTKTALNDGRSKLCL